MDDIERHTAESSEALWNDENGRWVLYADHLAAREADRVEIERLRREKADGLYGAERGRPVEGVTMEAIIPRTRCQGRRNGDADGTAGWASCPYFVAAHGLFCTFTGHHFDCWRVRRLKGCCWGKKRITITVEVEKP